jgi:hypothetical protein
MRRRAIAGALTIALVPLLAAARHARPGQRPDHHPDLQGVWDNSMLTPLERPADLADREFFPDQAAADYVTLEQYIVRLQARPTGSGARSGASARIAARRSSSIRRTAGCRR